MKLGKEYILTVLVAAILCGCITMFFKDKTGFGRIMKMLCGLFMVITVISPWTKMDFSHLLNYSESLQADGSSIVRDSELKVRKELSAIITEESEAYILDKAKQLGTELQVTISLSDDAYPVPNQIEIQGNVSPYNKSKLSTMIETDLGVPKERQVWIS